MIILGPITPELIKLLLIFHLNGPSTLQVDKIPVFIRTQMAVEWILSTVHTFRRENFLLV